MTRESGCLVLAVGCVPCRGLDVVFALGKGPCGEAAAGADGLVQRASA